MTSLTQRTRLRHILAIGAGLAVALLVFFYTGDSDFFIAVGSGFGGACLVYLSTYLPPRKRARRSKSRAF